MNTNYSNCTESINECKNDCYIENNCECDKYKHKSDELYMKAHYAQDESKRLTCEAKELDQQAKELERKAKELCAQANMTWDKAAKFESEANNLLDLASFYCYKASECYKNITNACKHKPTCTTWNGGCSCNK